MNRDFAAAGCAAPRDLWAAGAGVINKQWVVLKVLKELVGALRLLRDADLDCVRSAGVSVPRNGGLTRAFSGLA